MGGGEGCGGRCLTQAHTPQTGDRRSTPDGGAQVYGFGKWNDVHTEPGRTILRQTAEREDELAGQPCNIEAEQALLGALLMDPEAVFTVDGSIKAAHFFEPFHRRLYEAVRDQALKGRPTDPALLADRFRSDPAWADLGGTEYLGLLIDRAPPSANAPEYARTVAGLFTRRELIRLGKEFAHAALVGEADAEDLLADAERELGELAVSGGAQEEWIDGASVIAQAIESARSRKGVMDCVTGVAEVDEMLGGFNAGELAIIAGRPGMAKSVAASQIAKANAAKGRGTVFFSLEMGAEPLGLRLACDLAYDRQAPVYAGVSTNITFDHARKGKLSVEEWRRLDRAREDIDGWPLLFDTKPGQTVARMEQKARRAFARWKRQGIEPGCIIVDHMGLIRPDKDRQGSKYAETADISHALAAMAKRLGVPVICLCQLNRQVEGRGEDKRPTLSDLRQAGEIEEDARVVIFLLRPAYYLRPPEGHEDAAARAERESKLERCRYQLFWIVAKNNNGLTGQVETFVDVGCAAIRSREAA